MHAALVREVQSRADVAALTDVERAQLIAAGDGVLARGTLEDVLAWSDREHLGWYQLALERDGRRELDVWILANMDDGLVFDAGAASGNGIAISQTAVHDETEARTALCAEIRAALRAFESPPFREWSRQR